MPRHFLSMDALRPSEVAALLDRADALKRDRLASRALEGKSVAMIFEKPSTRTRVSFEVGIAELGGTPLALSASELQLGRGEPIEDTGRVLSRYVHMIVVRTFGQDRLEALGRSSSVPVVNALSDYEHPCQALADLQTMRERWGALDGRKCAYIGDGNNVAHSLLLACAKAGMHIAVATPPGFEPIPLIVDRAQEIAAETGGTVTVTAEPTEAADEADAIYTDVWASMGQEAEAETRRLIFARFRVDSALLSCAKPDAVVLHCLPAHRDEEIAADVLDGPRAVAWDQAENRLHAQKALMEFLVSGSSTNGGPR